VGFRCAPSICRSAPSRRLRCRCRSSATSARPTPASCSNNGARTSANTTGDLGANGILGIGPAPLDCGATCATSTSPTYNNYYACPNGNASCTVALVPTSQQVANPVHHFATDNNGA
jgi:hypothetical protein